MSRLDIAFFVVAALFLGGFGAGAITLAQKTTAPVQPIRLLHAGIIVSKATETVDGHPHCFVTISAKDTAGKYYKRTDEVNCWLYRNELKIGSWWQFAD